VKALSLTQPWASLVAIGAKHIETRSWPTSYRGQVAIHASKSFPTDCRDLCYLFGCPEIAMALEASSLTEKTLPLGAIVAVANLTGCDRITSTNPPQEPERTFGDYTPGRYAWRLDNIQPLRTPVPAKGALGLWEWPLPPEFDLNGLS
jgi:hypothetical protein